MTYSIKTVFSRLPFIPAAIISASLLSYSCSGESAKEETEPEEVFLYNGKSNISVSSSAQEFKIAFTTNCDWKITLEGPSAFDWLTLSNTEGTGTGKNQMYTIRLNSTDNATGAERTARLILEYGKKGESVTFNVSQSYLFPCTVSTLNEGMIFSTRYAGTLTSVQQSFDFYDDKSMLVFSQVTNYHKNTIGWGPRLTESGQELSVTPNRMTLLYFSHGNNIHYEKGSDGCDYIWIGNYGTVGNGSKYDTPQILSRVKMENGKTVKSFEASDNYYFGSADLHASFDEEHDQLAIFSREKGDNERSNTMKIYRLSEVRATPVTKVKLKYEVKYGGENAPDALVASFPEVMAHDCSNLKPIAIFNYQYYSDYGRSWQTYCIYGDKTYFFLFKKKKFDSDKQEIQSLIDIVDFKGNPVKQGILQPFANNIPEMTKWGFTDDANRYMENECILIRDNVMYLMYTAEINPDKYRHPVIFQFSIPE